MSTGWFEQLLDTDQKVVDFLNERDVTWTIVKAGNVKDLKRINKSRQAYTIEELDDIGGKYILKISKLNK